MFQSQEFQFENETPWENPAPGITRQLFGYDDTIMLVKAKFEKDAIGALHEHHHSQVTYVDSGVFEMTIGKEKKPSGKVTDTMCRRIPCMVVCAWRKVC